MSPAATETSDAGLVLKLGHMSFSLDELVSLILPETDELALVGIRDGDVATCYVWQPEWQAWWLGADSVGPLTQLRWHEATVNAEGLLEVGNLGLVAGPAVFGRSSNSEWPALWSGTKEVAQVNMEQWKIGRHWYERLRLTTRALPSWPAPGARDRPSTLAS